MSLGGERVLMTTASELRRADRETGLAILETKRVLMGLVMTGFAVISLAGFAINQTIVWFATAHLRWPLAMAEIPVVLIVPPATFLMSKFWAFRGPEPA